MGPKVIFFINETKPDSNTSIGSADVIVKLVRDVSSIYSIVRIIFTYGIVIYKILFWTDVPYHKLDFSARFQR